MDVNEKGDTVQQLDFFLYKQQLHFFFIVYFEK